MTVAELIALLQTHDPSTRVTLYDPDTNWLLPIKVEFLPADGVDRTFDFVAITGSHRDDLEGHGPFRP